MSPIAVIVDEADAQLGDRDSSGDSGVSNRVFAQIAQFMGNTEMRGKVIWLLLTSRPDLVPVDLKRQGRAEEHIALFYPDSNQERMALLHAMQRKTGTRIASPEAEKLFLERAGSFSGADIEALLVRARMMAVLKVSGPADVAAEGPGAAGAEPELASTPARPAGRFLRLAQCTAGRLRGAQGRYRGLHPAVLSRGDRAAEPRGRAGVHEPQPASGDLQEDGPGRGHASGARAAGAGGGLGRPAGGPHPAAGSLTGTGPGTLARTFPGTTL